MGGSPHAIVRPQGLPAIQILMVFPAGADGRVHVDLILKQQTRSAVAKWAKHFGVEVVEVEEWKDEESGARGLEYTATQETDRFRVQASTTVVVYPGTAPSATHERLEAAR